jgi:hypothetical protein
MVNIWFTYLYVTHLLSSLRKEYLVSGALRVNYPVRIRTSMYNDGHPGVFRILC